jgi:hypothetical protein
MKTTVIDVSNPANPQRVGETSAVYSANDLIVAGNKVFVVAGYDGLVILDRFRPSVRLETVSPQQPGGFRFLVRGEAGLNVRVQRSANLRDWEDWQTLTLGATPSELSDLDARDTPTASTAQPHRSCQKDRKRIPMKCMR